MVRESFRAYYVTTITSAGLAGGDYQRHSGPEAGDYTKTSYAQHGDIGTQVLRPLPNYNPPTYKVGGTAEVTWSIRNNHGSYLLRCIVCL